MLTSASNRVLAATLKLSCENLRALLWNLCICNVRQVMRGLAAHKAVRLLNRSEAHLVHPDYLETCFKVARGRSDLIPGGEIHYSRKQIWLLCFKCRVTALTELVCIFLIKCSVWCPGAHRSANLMVSQGAFDSGTHTRRRGTSCLNFYKLVIQKGQVKCIFSNSVNFKV